MFHEQVSHGATSPSSRDGLGVCRDRDPRNYEVIEKVVPTTEGLVSGLGYFIGD
jgi:hypothetical protein